MTQDEIIEMAVLAGLEQDGDMWFSNLYKTDMDVHINHLEAFAKLVEDAAFARWALQTKLAVQDEREACAVICEKQDWYGTGDYQFGYEHAVKNCADSIRERGKS
jgi:hypothetical protein